MITEPGELRLDDLGFLTDAVTAVGALTGASRLGVLERLDRGPATPAELAADCGLTAGGAALLLGALAGLGIVRSDESGRHHPIGIRPTALDRLLALGDGLPDVLRTGVPVIAAGTPDGAGQLYPAAVRHLGALMAAPAAAAARWLTGQRIAVGEVLDVGAGAAPWSLAVAAAVPGCRVTALDLPAVLPATRAAVTAAGLSDRFRFRAGNALTTDLPSQAYDLIMVGNLCHLFDGPTNARLLTRLTAALRPGAILMILDALPDTPAADHRSISLYALGLHARAGRGGLHPLGHYRQWATAAGLIKLGRVDLSDAPPITLVHAHRADLATGPTSLPGRRRRRAEGGVGQTWGHGVAQWWSDLAER
ncbi:class I SAM-dependent methyltransferase [Microlunatus speluncae]|uniref:class I SAM-dependent methyltransferase n=1 Tax=Microlunatus speluncae TaxID=2594267 RepID=UPI0012662593|nr:class I SAM-dependent methyltransferase [Microlunatus speluncae]